MRLSTIIKSLSPQKVINFKDVFIKNISCDTRNVLDEALFVAIPGTKLDGADFIPEAISKGCCAIITENNYNLPCKIPIIIVKDARESLAIAASTFYKSPSKKLKIVGITGTNGKTTTTYIIKSILEASGHNTGLIGTINYTIKNRKINSTNTTPNSIDLNSLFNEMLNENCKYAVVEVSSHSLTQKRVFGINFKQAIFTNLSRDHLDYHRTIEEYRNAKKILFDSLSENSFAIVNSDDENSDYMVKDTRAKIFRYGIYKNADLTAKIISSNLNGLKLELQTKKSSFVVESNLIGEHNAYNILSAVSSAILFKISQKKIIEGIKRVKSIRGRLEKIAFGKNNYAFIDYAHTPQALENVTTILRKLTQGRLITVFGCGGDRDKGKRPLMAQVVEKNSDYFIITSDNPRTEDPLAIIEDIKKGILNPSGENFEVEPDREKAIHKAIQKVREDDVVLIAGKGHETYQIFKNFTKPFDDVEVCIEAIKDYGYKI